MKKAFFLFLFAVFLLPSCNSYLSIEKRRYRSGYFVEQNLVKPRNEINTELPQRARKIHREVQGNSDIVFSTDISAPLAVNDSSVKNILSKNINQIAFDTLLKKYDKKKGVWQKFNKEEYSIRTKKNSPLAVIGFILALLSAAILFIGLDILIIWFVFIISGLHFSILGKNQINKNHNKYKGKVFALIGIIVTGAILFLSLLFIAIFILSHPLKKG